MVREWSGGVDFDTVAGDGDLRVLSARGVSTRGKVGADVFRGGGERNCGVGGVDRDVPLVPGDVPVELIEVFVEFEGVGDGVFDVDGLDRVVGIVDEDFEFAVVAFAGGFVLQQVAGAVCDAFDVKEKRIVHALGGEVLDGDFTIEAVPGAAEEMDGDGFGDGDGRVGEDVDLGVEALDAEFFGEKGRGKKK